MMSAILNGVATRPQRPVTMRAESSNGQHFPESLGLRRARYMQNRTSKMQGIAKILNKRRNKRYELPTSDQIN